MNLKVVLSALRPHHWSKNLLVFLPLITGHQLLVWNVLFNAIQVFFCLCAVASAGYIVNDYLDLASDRQHPLKKNRPLAAGQIRAPTLLACAAVLSALGFGFAWQINEATAVALIFYFSLSLLYSLFLKRQIFLDILFLSGFFIMRLIIGHEASGIVYSAWLFAFAMFFFLSLACLKRCAELQRLKGDGQIKALGRGYVIEDLPIVTAFGIISGYISVLVFALYINSSSVLLLYTRPQVLWLACPLLLYWLSCTWLLSHRGLIPEDPIPYMFKDKKNYFLALIMAIILVVAT